MRSLVVLALLCLTVEPAKILFFTFPFSNSQVIYTHRVSETLCDAGHEVVIVRPHVNLKATKMKSKHPRVREIFVTHGYDPEVYGNYSRSMESLIFKDPSFGDILVSVNAMKQMQLKTCEMIYGDHSLIEELKAEKFDFAIQHHVGFCEVAVINHLGIKKWIHATSVPPTRNYLTIAGIPVPHSLIPGLLFDAGIKMTFWQRLNNFLFEMMVDNIGHPSITKLKTVLARKYLDKDMPEVLDIAKTSSLILINSDPVVDYPLPVTKKACFIGGIGVKKAVGELPKEFASFIASAKKIVVVTFGSIVAPSKMPQEWKDSFIKMFKDHPDVHFIWRYDGEVVVPDNVLASTWIPQNQLLAQNKTVAFVTHGGYNGFMEAVHLGVPLVVVPLFGDQFRNAHVAVDRGLAVRVNKEELNGDALSEALGEIVRNSRYAKAAKDLYYVIEHKPVKAEQELLFWVDVILNTDVSLELPQLSTIVLFNLDLIAFIIGSSLAVLLVLRQLAKWFYWSCCQMAFKEKIKIQ